MFWGLVEMTFGLVYASFRSPEWQALKMTFFAPCHKLTTPTSPPPPPPLAFKSVTTGGLYLEQAILFHLFEDCRFVASCTHSLNPFHLVWDRHVRTQICRIWCVLLRVTTKSSLIVLRFAQYTCDKTVIWLYSWIRSTIEETKEMSPLQLVIHMIQDCNALGWRARDSLGQDK